MYVYIYICVCGPGPNGVLYNYLREGHGKAILRNPGGREQNQGPWSCRLMWPLLPQTEEATAQDSWCPELRVQRLWTCMTVLAFSLS